MKKRRILHVLNATGGGAPLSALQLMQALPADEFESYAVIPPEDKPGDMDRFRAVAKHVEVVPLPWWSVRTRT